MSEKSEITFMQTRLIRLASEEWQLPLEKIIELFRRLDKESGGIVVKFHTSLYKSTILCYCL